MIDTAAISRRFSALAPFVDERVRRLNAASEALAIGPTGISIVSRATGLSRQAIRIGIAELKQGTPTLPPGRARKPGGGRKPLTAHDPELEDELEKLVEPHTRGDPESPLRWTTKSSRTLADELSKQGHQVSHMKVTQILHKLKYSLQGNRKTKEGSSHPDRDAQFQYINTNVTAALAAGEPVISVDAKKKELVGDFKNAGRTWRPRGEPEEVRVYDFALPEWGRATPYGVYDFAHNTGWVSVGIDHDTAEFAVATIRTWWQRYGRTTYPAATHLHITADGGGSNGSRHRLWKWELQRWADESGLTLNVHHFPPGTSKWNKIEHRLFSAITQNWHGTPLVSYGVILQLIAATRTKTGLTVDCALDIDEYPTGIKITDEEMATLHIKRADFHGDWNYTIRPRNKIG